MSVFKNFLFSKYARWYWITLSLILSILFAIVFIPANDYPLVYVRIMFGGIFLLYLPGFALTQAMFPSDTSAKKIDKIERFALSFGLSVAVIPIIGMILNYTPWGIVLESLTTCIAGLTTIFATIALLREYATNFKL